MILGETMLNSLTLSDLSPLANHLWQSTLCVAVVWLLTLALEKNRAAVRYWLWLAASVKFLLPFSLLVSLGSQITWRRTASVVVQPQWSYLAENIGRPFSITSPVAQAVASPASNLLPIILLAVWFSGFLTSIAFWFRWWIQIRAARRKATPLALGLPIPVMFSSTRVEPGVVGVWKPVLLLPEGIADRLTPQQMHAVLAHEMCHVRRRDNLTAAIHMLVEAVLWFYPLVWWIRARLVEEREQACDEAVLQSGSDAEDYAESILNVCKFYVESPLACVSGISGSDLKGRIVRIMTEQVARKLDFSKKLLLGVAGLAAVTVPIVFGLVNATPSRAESQAENKATIVPVFEVASIRPDKGGNGMFKIGWLGDSIFTAKGATLQMLIQLAYGVQDNQISGGSNRLDSERYNIEAKADSSVVDELHKLSKDQRKLATEHMLQALLADRFNLKLHRETKELSVYTLVVAKNGPKFHPSKTTGMMRMNKGLIVAQGVPLALLVERLSFQLGRTVVDKTGLAGSYDYTLRWTPDESQAPMFAGTEGGRPGANNAPPPDSFGPSIFTALEEQLGLKLKSEKGPVEVLVIDHVEQPSAN